jgi:saccharopine dehydrogenase-like NADP-dependent oxidoreductase
MNKPTTLHTILVLGGYGFFGSRICEALAKQSRIHLLIGGRNLNQAQALASKLGLQVQQGVAIDAQSFNLAQQLTALQVDTVIHTAGPFQGQNYTVAYAAIAARANYIDLADGRDFVAGIEQLHTLACESLVFVTSGASSLPALSSAVIDRYFCRFSHLQSVYHGIASGARAPGLATMKGVLGYCGKPFLRLKKGHWETTHGWLNLQRYRFPKPVGVRLLGSCDVPDLVLFPKRYPHLQTVAFYAGFASLPGHLFLWLASYLVRMKCLSSLNRLVAPLHAISRWLEPFVSDKGAMFVSMEGVGLDGQPLKLDWHLLAAQNHGPYIPCGASIALAKKLAQGERLPHGAMPCVGLLGVDEYLAALQNFDVREIPA